MARCIDCGERMAAWDDYCPRCGARKALKGPGSSKNNKKKSFWLLRFRKLA